MYKNKMGKIRVNLCRGTRDSIRKLAEIATRNCTVSLTQARRILRTAVEASLKKCITSARLTFIYHCIHAKLFVNSVEKRAETLKLSKRVTRTIKIKMMKRIRSDIYRERNEKVKLAKEAARKAKNLLNDSDYKNLEGVEHNELERHRESLRKHYEKQCLLATL